MSSSRNRNSTTFATSRFMRYEVVDGLRVRLPASETHAKIMGTTVTVCGESALSWYKFWDLPYSKVQTARCPRCTAIVRSWLSEYRSPNSEHVEQTGLP